ncbi:MAG: hypothetical protein MRJ92_02740 [Nitrospira sp.]|nr:hypothetical protein [Nitrospira sp.]
MPHRLETRCPIRLEGRGCDISGNHPCGNWELVVRGIFHSSNPAIMGEGELYVHWQFANERLKGLAPDRVDQVGWYVHDGRG